MAKKLTKKEKLRKLLYLLQLEEYQLPRWQQWLKKYPIEKLEERKKKLVFTWRIKTTFILATIFSFFKEEKEAVAKANKITSPLFSFIKRILIFWAKFKLHRRSDLIRIVITGSYGKTTFKEMLAWVLAEKFSVLKTPENFNTEVSIVKTIISLLKPHHQILIIEAGAYAPGEIKKICQLVKPDFGIVTVIGLMHLERFGSQKNIRKTKLEIVPFIKNKEHLFLPSKNNEMIDFPKTVRKIALQLGMSPQAISRRLRSFSPPAHRLQEKHLAPNVILLDDTYNANPIGAQRALKKLSSFKKYQKIVITPGMIEFGRKQFAVNFQLGKRAAEIADIFFIIGRTNRRALLAGAQKAKKKGEIICLEADEDWNPLLTRLLKPPTVILLENDLPDHYF
ncbi:hypothetical protein J7J95_00340 [bacterium]|nr:hypothetical protein [bacterium]